MFCLRNKLLLIKMQVIWWRHFRIDERVLETQTSRSTMISPMPLARECIRVLAQGRSRTSVFLHLSDLTAGESPRHSYPFPPVHQIINISLDIRPADPS